MYFSHSKIKIIPNKFQRNVIITIVNNNFIIINILLNKIVCMAIVVAVVCFIGLALVIYKLKTYFNGGYYLGPK